MMCFHDFSTSAFPSESSAVASVKAIVGQLYSPLALNYLINVRGQGQDGAALLFSEFS